MPRGSIPARVRKSVEHGLGSKQATTLQEGVLAVFPLSSRPKLEAWQQRVRDEAHRAPQPLLFIALLCGTQFRVFHVEARPVLEELRGWLTSHPRKMRRELSELVIEALTPAIESVLKARGWQAGPEGKSTALKGRPRETTGAWAAGVLAELYLRGDKKSSAVARTLAEELVSALVGRSVATREFSTARRNIDRPETSQLLQEVTGAYGALIEVEARRRLNPPPPASDRLGHAKWLARSRAIPYTLAVDGADTIARKALAEMKHGIWAVLAPQSSRGASRKAPAKRGSSSSS